MLFVHQYPDWTNFRYDLRAVTHLLSEVRLLQGKISGQASIVLSREDFQEIRERDIQELISFENKENATKAARSGIFNTISAATRNYNAPLTAERLIAWHAALVRGGGHFRNLEQQNTTYLSSFNNAAIKVNFDSTEKETSLFINFPGVDAERLPAEISHFLQFFENDSMDLVLKAAMAHFWFIAIFPFQTENTTLAWLLSDFLLSKSDNVSNRIYSIHAAVASDANSYFKILNKTMRQSGEITEWLVWFLQTFKRALLQAEEFLKPKLVAACHSLSFARLSLSAREQKLIAHLEKNQTEISSSVWAHLADISHDSALRDLGDLVQKGILQKNDGKGRRSRYRLLLSHLPR